MKSLLVHGCYDAQTLQTLEELGVRHFGFDLRPRSPNLVTFGELKKALKGRAIERSILIFENEKLPTVAGALDLLRDTGVRFELEFRDSQSAQYYALTNLPFYWVWRVEGDWRNILELPNLRGLILPLQSRESLMDREFWDLVDENEIEVFIHPESLERAQGLAADPELSLSVDLSSEVESAYRSVDQNKLRNFKLWTHL